jgi:ribosomal-protein-alanine N-acetyltransferase
METDTVSMLPLKNIVPVDGEFYLSDIVDQDIPELVLYLNDDVMYENTLKIPKPYTAHDGAWFVNFCNERKKIFGKTMEWCIRDETHRLIGGIGLQGNSNEGLHREVIGYWLAKPFWNQKIMSRVIPAFCEFVFNRDKYVRLEAHVYVSNIASCRILEKAGFVKEGIMKKFIFKDGIYIDTYLYALVK